MFPSTVYLALRGQGWLRGSDFIGGVGIEERLERVEEETGGEEWSLTF